MRKVSYLFLYFLLFTAVNSFGKGPKNPFVDTGACPFECCKYQKWLVVKDTPIYDKVGGGKQVDILKKGSKIEAVTGEVHIEPNPDEVIFDKGKYTKGEKIFLLTPQGEGFYKIWYQGKIDSIEVLDFFDNSGNPKECIIPSGECWGRPMKSMLEQKRDWWIKFKTSKGKTGWSDKANNFSENDSCS